MTHAAGTLYLVSTPIGHLDDMTYRAVEVLKRVALICAEDTRHARTLLERYEVRTPVRSYHAHNEARSTPALVERLTSGADIALVSDAGTPLLSDPGQRLVRAAIEAGIPVVPVPGASALLAALVASGLDSEHFTFLGFIPRSGTARQQAVARLSALDHTSVVYESPARLAATLHDFASAGLGERGAVVAREITKKHEEFRRGTVGQLAAYYAANPVRGEVVILLGGAAHNTAEPDDDAVLRRARDLLGTGTSSRDVVAALVAEFGLARNRAYRLTQEAQR